MYILLSEENIVTELIPDENPAFPGVPIEKRYAPAFVAKLLHVSDDSGAAQNLIYDPETGTFSQPPPPPEPEPAPEPATAAQRREAAYNEDRVIQWPAGSGELLTVTEAAAQWEYYAAEGGTETAGTLTAMIAAAKAEIRARYPDGE